MGKEQKGNIRSTNMREIIYIPIAMIVGIPVLIFTCAWLFFCLIFDINFEKMQDEYKREI